MGRPGVPGESGSEPFMIGDRYRVERPLGEGGMGTVYLAQQSRPVRRQVALKVLRADLDSERVLARFEGERQALAVMDHPAIATLFEAGTMADGRSYFAMEFVDGLPITRYCDDRRLTLRDRVRLLVEVCRGVQHAHQKGVLHRDLKPSNLLVTQVDGRATARIIDFGLAKATYPEAFDGRLQTRHDEVIGTPAYMSPEQIGGGGDVDTRTDVYALGVVLYEVLAGALPFDRAAYRGWAAVAAQLTREPPSLVRRFRDLGDTQQTIAGNRSSTPAALRRELSGDLGWIVARAMEKDRDHRYETVNALALDLERFLSHEPVRARAASARYRVGRFVRRNWIGVSVASAAVIGLTAFATLSRIQASRIAQARDEAESRRAQAERLIDFMLGDLRDKLTPIGQLPILDRVNDEAVSYFSSIPQDQFSDDDLSTRARSLRQAGSVRMQQGDFDSAARAYDESLRLATEMSARAPDDLERLFERSQSEFYVGYAAWRGGDFPTAEAHFQGYLDIAEALVERDPDNLDYRLEVGFAHGNLGSVYESRGELSRAVEAYAHTLRVKADLVSLDSTNVDRVGELAESHNKLGLALLRTGAYGPALEQHRRELGLKRQVRELHADHAYWRHRTAVALGFLADLHRTTGSVGLALDLASEQRLLLDSLVAFDPTNTDWRRARAMGTRARAESWMADGRLIDAERDLTFAASEMGALLSVESAPVGWRIDLASVLGTRARLDLAKALPASALAAASQAVGFAVADRPMGNQAKVLVGARLARGRALDALDRFDEARVEWQSALSTIESMPLELQNGLFRPLRAEALALLGRPEEALQTLEELRGVGYDDPALAGLIESPRGRLRDSGS